MKGIGAKTAVKLLSEYNTLDNVYAHIDEIKGALNKKLVEGKESAYLSQKLAQIVTDAPIVLNIEECVAQDFDAATVLELFRELEFRSLTNTLMEGVDTSGIDVPAEEDLPGAGQETDVTVVRTPEQLADLVRDLEQAEMISFDVETTGLKKMTADVVGICLAVNRRVAITSLLTMCPVRSNPPPDR
ncbi:MAG: 5'-3' exonuclease H3TH domain-containing protein [Chloroflexota bacterium]